MSTKQHVRRIFQWLVQVNADKNLPSSAFKIAFVIAQHLNEETGEAWPSTETIGSHCALYPSSVRAMVDNLVEHGHLAVEWGRKGRGHPNKYGLILKPQQAAVSTPSKKPQQAAVLKSRRKPQPDEIKPQPDDLKTAAGCHEPLKNHLNNHQSAAPPRSSARVERGHVTETQNTSDDAPQNPAFSTSDDAAIAEPLIPNQRAPEVALIEPFIEQEQPPPPASPMGRAAHTHANPAFAPVYRRGRELLGADADAVTAKLLSAYDGDVEGALDTLACAEEMSDPRQYIERDIEAAARDQARRTGRQ